MFPCGALFSGVFNEIVIEVPQFHKCHPTLSWKISGCAPALIYYFFSKSHYLNCLTVFWIRLCLDICLVICIMTLCYVLHQTHSEYFWHIQYSVFSGIWRHIQAYSLLLSIFTHIETLLSHILTYLAIFITLCNPRIFATLH